MKICLFTTTLDKKDGGPSRSIPLLAKGLSEIGVEVTLITCSSSDMNLHILDNSQVQVEIISENITRKNLEKIIVNNGYSLIHAQNLWLPLYHKIAVIARKNRIPYMMTPRGCLEPWSMKQKRIKKFLALYLYQKQDLQKAACILATSEMEAQNIRNLGIHSPIAIIPNGIDITEYRCRDINSINKIKKQICFISRIHKKKGIEILINAWEVLCKRYPDWQVVVAGNGEEAYINTLKVLIANKGLNNRFKIIPPVFGKEKRELYYESTLFVLPTYSENFGMVIAEAMSCGLPVITTKGTPWQVLDYQNLGWCIDLSLDNLIKVLSSAINKDKKDLFNMGQRGSKYVNSMFQYKKVAKQNKTVYEWIIGDWEKPEYVID